MAAARQHEPGIAGKIDHLAVKRGKVDCPAGARGAQHAAGQHADIAACARAEVADIDPATEDVRQRDRAIDLLGIARAIEQTDRDRAGAGVDPGTLRHGDDRDRGRGKRLRAASIGGERDRAVCGRQIAVQQD